MGKRDWFMFVVGLLLGGLILLGLYCWAVSRSDDPVQALLAQADRARDPIAAGRFLDQAVARAPQDVTNHELVRALCAAGRTATGLEMIERHLRASPDDTWAMQEQIACHVQAGHLEEGLALQEQLVARIDQDQGGPWAKLMALQASPPPVPVALRSLSLPVRLQRTNQLARCGSDEALVGGGCGERGIRVACIPGETWPHSCDAPRTPLCIRGVWDCPFEAGMAESSAPAFALCVERDRLR